MEGSPPELPPDPQASLTQRLATALDPTRSVVRDDGTIIPRSLLDVAAPDADGPVRDESDLALGETIGEGGMGRVRSGRQIALRREVAVKSLRVEGSRHAATALLREAFATGALEHPNVVPVYAIARDPRGRPLIVMKRIRGVSWEALLAAPEHPMVPRAPDELLQWHLEILLQVCNAVRFAHSKGIVHRDIKPANVMIGDFGEVYLLDWGLAVSAGADPALELPQAEEVRELAGTPGYMAPEMVDPERGRLGRHTDIYLLGAVLHEIVTGEVRHPGATPMARLFHAHVAAPHTYGDSVPAELAAACERATHADPAARFPTVEALQAAIRQAIRHANARELTRQAGRRLETLKRRVRDAGADGASIQKLFIECRFAFQEALRTWDADSDARAGLRTALHEMARFELERGARAAAEELVAQIDEPEPELLKALRRLERGEEAEKKRIARLEAISRDVDANVGLDTRFRLIALMAVGWAASNFTVGHLAREGIYSIGYEFFLVQDLLLMAAVTGLVAFFRRALLGNAANRRMVVLAYVLMTGICVHFFIDWTNAVPFAQSLMKSQLLLALLIGASALTLDPRALPSAGAFVLSYALGTLEPRLLFESYGLGGAGAFGWVAWSWRPGRARRRPTRDTRDTQDPGAR